MHIAHEIGPAPLPQRRGPVSWIVLVVGSAVGVAGVVVTFAQGGIDRPAVAVLFFSMVFVGELIRVSLPGERDTAPLGGSAAVGYSLLLFLGPGMRRPAGHSAYAVIAVVAVASAAAIMLLSALDRDPRPRDVARRVLVCAAIAGVFRGSGLTERLDSSPFGWEVSKSGLPVLAMIVAVLAGGLLDVFIAAVVRAERDRAPIIPTFRNELLAFSGIGFSMAAIGMLIALGIAIIGMWTLPIIAVPLLVTQFSFRRYAAIRRTYRQTISALSRVTEVGGYVEPGHSRRVTRLSVAIGREFGMREQDLLDLEYAALMHDIGQLSLADSIPRGSTLHVAPAERRRIAAMGADVIRSTGTLDRVAMIVETQAHPYRRMRENGDLEVPLEARIIRAASAFDDLVTASEAGGRQAAWNALERLRMGMAYEYDPRVVEALTRVLEKNSAL
ncbi:MAG: HD domain-containing phosphohydrolase [Mycobacteriales bacterium]